MSALWEDNSNCTQCKTGFYVDEGSCLTCGSKFENCTECTYDGSSCTMCESGYYVDEGYCSTCDSGYEYETINATDRACKVCNYSCATCSV